MSFFSKFDIFKQPVQLKLKKHNTISTHLGKLVTFFMVFYAIYTLFKSNLVLRRNPTVKVENLKPLFHPHLNFNSSNFTFAVGLYDLELGYVNDPTMFSYSAGLLLWDNSNNNFVDTKLEMGICNEFDFKNAGENFKGTFQNNLFCFRLKNETIHLFGSYNERMIKFLYLDLNRCKNSSKSNLTCKTIEQQEKFLQGRYQDFIFQNDAIDYSNYYNPLQKDVKKYFVTIDLGFSKIITTYLKHFSFFSDKGFFFEEKEREDSYIVENVVYDFQSNNFETENKPLARLELYSDSQETIHFRKYQHIQDLLAEMGGVLNIFILFGMLAINLELPYIMTKKISSELYSYQFDKKITGNNKNKGVRDDGDENKENPNAKLENRRNSRYKKFTKTITSTDISPIYVKDTNDEKDKVKKTEKIDLRHEEKILPIKDLFRTSDLENKEKEAESRMQENNIYPYQEKFDLRFFVKIPKMQGDEEMIDESEDFFKNNAQIPGIAEISEANKSKILKNNAKKEMFKKNRSFIQSAIRFSIDFKKKLNFGSLLENQMKHGSKNFPINFLSYLSILFKCKRFKLNQTEKLFLLGEEQIKKDLDIFKIITCMNDVEKLKMILLNDKQRYLFNLLQKPIITNKKINQEEETNALIVGKKKKINRCLVETYYRDLVAHQEKSEIDKRILLLLDTNLLASNSKIFE